MFKKTILPWIIVSLFAGFSDRSIRSIHILILSLHAHSGDFLRVKNEFCRLLFATRK